MRGATAGKGCSLSSRSDFNPRSSCEERRTHGRGRYWRDQISIHAPHARSDLRRDFPVAARHISIHAPHARSDFVSVKYSSNIKEFQSTLLMRGATRPRIPPGSSLNFNPRSSCEERRSVVIGGQQKALFQSTLLMRGATRENIETPCWLLFQSTLLMRGAT